MSHEIRLAVVGWRGYKDYAEFVLVVETWMKRHHTPDIIITGDEPNGTDAMAVRYATEKGYKLVVHRADWKGFAASGRNRLWAGPARNTIIARDCTHLLAFPSLRGSGTQDTVKKAKRLGKHVTQKFVGAIE